MGKSPRVAASDHASALPDALGAGGTPQVIAAPEHLPYRVLDVNLNGARYTTVAPEFEHVASIALGAILCAEPGMVMHGSTAPLGQPDRLRPSMFNKGPLEH